MSGYSGFLEEWNLPTLVSRRYFALWRSSAVPPRPLKALCRLKRPGFLTRTVTCERKRKSRVDDPSLIQRKGRATAKAPGARGPNTEASGTEVTLALQSARPKRLLAQPDWIWYLEFGRRRAWLTGFAENGAGGRPRLASRIRDGLRIRGSRS